ncbi:hypothetical protein PISMIDRAFT_671119 [Pisolithus microcarpus 441]|uniref:Uncharacterized protein n=1 Tax=Pisolithus microcarpus 441 TaxID=765257 RepID=A0A0D0A6P3_9AGAM|nr:hypothetical protein PISMIDRAFT_671119 [Pisolithus microcarpus 441]
MSRCDPVSIFVVAGQKRSEESGNVTGSILPRYGLAFYRDCVVGTKWSDEPYCPGEAHDDYRGQQMKDWSAGYTSRAGLN